MEFSLILDSQIILSQSKYTILDFIILTRNSSHIFINPMQNKKLIESEFVVKIIDMIKEHPDIVNWNENGTQLYLPNIDAFCQKMLPQYFRHSNFNSFIRQLNIYNFHKTKKVGRSMSFKNDVFRKGNQNNFFLIQRKRKFKELENFQQRFQKQYENIISQVCSKRQITPQTQDTLITLLEYKYVSHVNLKRVKCQLDALHKDLKDSRNKKIQDICIQLKSQLLTSINQLTTESKKIDQYISENLFKEKESIVTNESLEQITNERLYNRQLQSSFISNQNCMKNHQMIKQQLSQKQNYAHNEVKQNIRSYNSFHIFLEEFKTKKQQFTYDHKLYHPFNSQNSFMFLPNYIGGPSQIPIDGKYNNQYQYKVDQNPQSEQKNISFDDYDQSASISFVKDFSEDRNQDFSSV